MGKDRSVIATPETGTVRKSRPRSSGSSCMKIIQNRAAGRNLKKPSKAMPLSTAQSGETRYPASRASIAREAALIHNANLFFLSARYSKRIIIKTAQAQAAYS